MSLLKNFFKVLANRLPEFLLRNSYIDITVQKGGVPGMPIDPGGKGELRRLGSHLVQPCQYIWIHTTQAGGIGINNTPRSGEVQQPNTGLL